MTQCFWTDLVGVSEDCIRNPQYVQAISRTSFFNPFTGMPKTGFYADSLIPVTYDGCTQTGPNIPQELTFFKIVAASIIINRYTSSSYTAVYHDFVSEIYGGNCRARNTPDGFDLSNFQFLKFTTGETIFLSNKNMSLDATLIHPSGMTAGGYFAQWSAIELMNAVGGSSLMDKLDYSIGYHVSVALKVQCDAGFLAVFNDEAAQ